MSKIIRNVTEDELTFVSGAATLAEVVRGAFDHDERTRTIGLLDGGTSPTIQDLVDAYQGNHQT